MNCNDIRPLLSAYYDGEVTPEENSTVERHLATCADCRSTLAEYRAIGGDIRALPMPVPPAGLRRDVWRTIEKQPANRPSAATTTARGRTSIANNPTTEERKANRPTNLLGMLGQGWGKALPAASLFAAMLLIFAVVTIIRSTPAQAASLLDKSPVDDYTQPLHVQFSKPVDEQSAENNTALLRMDASGPYTVTNVVKSYDSIKREMTISSQSVWQAGANYEVYINAPNIRTGIGQDTLGDNPIRLAFSTSAFTPTPTNTPTRTPTSTRTPNPTNTPEPTAVAGVPPTSPTSEPVTSPTATAQATATYTHVATPVASSTPVPSNTPVESSPTPTVHATQPTATPGRKTPSPRPTGVPTITPTPACDILPVNGFGKLWEENSEVRSRLECPTDSETALPDAAEQHFQGGYMFWRGDTRSIYVFLGGTTGTWYEYHDMYEEGEPTPLPFGTPPPGLYEPMRGFGKLWHTGSGLRQALGWATAKEKSITAAWQPFQGGKALWTDDHTIRILFDDDAQTWESFPDTYVPPVPPMHPVAATSTPTPRRSTGE